MCLHVYRSPLGDVQLLPLRQIILDPSEADARNRLRGLSRNCVSSANATAGGISTRRGNE